MVGKYISMVVWDRRWRDLLVWAGGASGGVGLGRMWGSPWACWWSVGFVLLARCPSAMHSSPVRIVVPGVLAPEYQRGLQV